MSVTDETEWSPWLAQVGRAFPDEHHERAVVVAAHPDDETLGLSGLMQHLHERGTAVSLVVATDGEAAFPALSAPERAALGRTRRAELADALRAQGLTGVDVHWLGLPDSALAERTAELAERLGCLLAGANVCFVPWPDDPHPDHRTVAEVALAVAPVTAHRWSYPIWMWHWMRPADVPADRTFGHRMTEQQRRRKAAGLAAFTSQLKPGPYGEEPILRPDMLRHFERDVEVVYRQPPQRSAPISRFVELYEGAGDPWDVAGKWYERRKRAVLLAALPRERYGTAVEPACGNGVLTRALAERCDRVLAFDPVPGAVARCEALGMPNVDVTTGRLPDDMPGEPADLVVLSEILYYLGDDDLRSTVDKAVAALRPGGHIAAVHWLPWAAEAPRDGMAAHRALLTHPALERLVEHVDERFVLHVVGRR